MKRIFTLLALLLFSPASFSWEFRVLTFNAWILEDPIFGYELSKETDQRVNLMPVAIAKTESDVIFFQEVWSETKRNWLIEQFRALGYPYAAFHQSSPSSFRGRLGNGLLIISRFQLDPEIQTLHFSEYTRVEEFFAQKGAIKTRALIPTFGWIDIYNSHLGAVTAVEGGFNAVESATRFRQTQELANFIAETSISNFAILGADLNSHYFVYRDGHYQEEYSPEYALLTCFGQEEKEKNCLGFRDSYRDVHGFEKNPVWTFSNYPMSSGTNQIFKHEPKGVIDYIFSTAHPKFIPRKSKIVFNEKLDPKSYGDETPEFLSDHGGVMTTYSVRP